MRSEKEISKKIDTKYDTAPAIAIGFLLGLVGGVVGMFSAELIGFGRQDTIFLIGGFGGLAVALFFNKTAKSIAIEYEEKIQSLEERINELLRDKN